MCQYTILPKSESTFEVGGLRMRQGKQSRAEEIHVVSPFHLLTGQHGVGHRDEKSTQTENRLYAEQSAPVSHNSRYSVSDANGFRFSH